MRCTFCATGKGGFARNLLPHEIIDQVMTVQEAFGQVRWACCLGSWLLEQVFGGLAGSWWRMLACMTAHGAAGSAPA